MKKNININLYGTLYAIDEDAYQLLDSYLENMKAYFSHRKSGTEIADDIEHRIAELLWEHRQQGNQTVDIDTVKRIIEEMGNPEQMADGSDTLADDQTDEERPTDTPDGGNLTSESRPERRFFRDPDERVLGGVLSGIAAYFGIQPIYMRFIFCILLFFSVGWGILAYIVLCICMRPARTAEERLMMKGRPVNPDTIRAEVLSHDSGTGTKQGDGCLRRGLIGCGGCFIAMLMGLFVILMCGFILGGLSAIIDDLDDDSEVPAPVRRWFKSHVDWDVSTPLWTYRHSSRSGSTTFTCDPILPVSDADRYHFDALDIESTGLIRYTPGANDTVLVTSYGSDCGLPEGLHANIIDSVLTLRYEGERTLDMTCDVSSPTLRSLHVAGVGQFVCTDTIRGRSLSCRLEGIGDAQILADVDTLVIACEGVGSVSVAGRAKVLRKSAEGIGSIDVDELRIVE